jgi:hypothetical protein
MPDQPASNPQPLPPKPPADPEVYGGQWGDGDTPKQPGPPPNDRPDKITPSPDKD